jgi:hypothetical protein
MHQFDQQTVMVQIDNVRLNEGHVRLIHPALLNFFGYFPTMMKIGIH